MDEHIFGTFATDELKFLHERVRAQGVQHRARVVPPDPQPGQSFTLLLTTGPDVGARGAIAFYSCDGTVPDETSPYLRFRPGTRHWSTPAWGYVTEWQAEVPPLPEGTLFHYRIKVEGVSGARAWADWPDPKRAVELALVAGGAAPLPPSAPVTFARSIDFFTPPPWASEAVVYQLFLDRFARSDGAAWPAHQSLAAIHGGTLRGVREHLPYIAALGATCLWLSPLFPSPTHHRYDATDYFAVDPRLGSKEELHALVSAAHERGMRVLLDFVCNHLGDEHPTFQRALADPTSTEREWFWIDPAHEPHGYRTFFGVRTMPELNTDHPAVRAHLLEAASMWVREYDVDGFRLDYAHGPSHAFWAHFWRALKQLKPEVWCFGEIVDTPETQRSYVGFLDGVLDFQVGEWLRHLFAFQRRSLLEWVQFLHDHEGFFPPHHRFSRPAFLDNHDMNRFLHAAGGNVARLRLAALVLYTLPNPPILYYGTEVGLAQRESVASGGLEAAREPMAWERVERDEGALLHFFQRLGALRHRFPAMRSPLRRTLHVTADTMLQALGPDEAPLLLLVNRSDRAETIHHGALVGTFRSLLDDQTVEADGGLRVGAEAGLLLQPQASYSQSM